MLETWATSSPIPAPLAEDGMALGQNRIQISGRHSFLPSSPHTCTALIAVPRIVLRNLAVNETGFVKTKLDPSKCGFPWFAFKTTPAWINSKETSRTCAGRMTLQSRLLGGVARGVLYDSLIRTGVVTCAN